MAAWQYSFHVVSKLEIEGKYGHIPESVDESFLDNTKGWKEIELNSIDQILRESFGVLERLIYGPLIFGKEDMSCVQLIFESSVLEVVSVRLDLRGAVSAQIDDTIRLCQLIDGLILTSDFEILPADRGNLIQSIKDSYAFKFVQDPLGYLESLKTQK